MTTAKRHTPPTDPPLADTLRLMMPSAPTALLLQAALLQGDAVNNAWSEWRKTVADPKAFLASDRVGIKRHLPLLYRNLAAHGADIGRDLEPYFRAARAREELRSERYRRFLAEALAALEEAGVEFVIGKGVTVGETIHDDPVVRHSHDIDLLVRHADLRAAAAALSAAGFAPVHDPNPRGERRFDHSSGLPVELHDRLYRTPLYHGKIAGPWNRARRGKIAGTPALLMGDADLLVHALVHASSVSQRRGLSWITDAVCLLRRREADGAPIDWAAVVRIVGETDAALPVFVMCDYLATTFNAPIPAHVIQEFRRSANEAGPMQHLAALDGLRADARHRRIKVILDASGPRSRMAIARAMLLPPRAYLKVRYPGIGPLPLTSQYLKRPLRFAGRQASRFRRRAATAVLPDNVSPDAGESLT